MNVNILPVMINEDNYQPRPAPHLQADSIASVEKVRDILENRSLSDYENAIGDYDLLYSKYKETAKWNMKVQFLKNFYRYSPSTTFGMIKEYFNK